MRGSEYVDHLRFRAAHKMAETETLDPFNRDTSTFVEHLRLVHFTLVLTCLVALIAASSQAPTSAARAYEEVNQLIILKDRWQGGRWLYDEINRNKSSIDQIELVLGSPERTITFLPVTLLWPPLNHGTSYYWFLLATTDDFTAVTIDDYYALIPVP